MKRSQRLLRNIALTIIILLVCFGLCLIIQYSFATDALIPSVFVLGAFLISVLTDGYLFGLSAVFISVLMVNYAFTFPYFRLNFSLPENMVSAIIMVLVAVITCALTTELKRQQAEKAEGERERMRANLLRSVSHDFRTPLTTIYGSSCALLENEDQFTKQQKMEMLRGMKEEAQWLSRMVENLLSITKLSGGNVKIIKTQTVLDELIDSVLMKFNKRYPNREVSVDIPDGLVLIDMDAVLIEQVLINLLENAVIHASGMTRLSLRVFVISKKAIFEVQDDGCGLDEDKLKHIFSGDIAERETPSDGKINNAGIGLSVCASIIHAHGGDIRAENAKDGGTVFRFTLDTVEAMDE